MQNCCSSSLYVNALNPCACEVQAAAQGSGAEQEEASVVQPRLKICHRGLHAIRVDEALDAYASMPSNQSTSLHADYYSADYHGADYHRHKSYWSVMPYKLLN